LVCAEAHPLHPRRPAPGVELAASIRAVKPVAYMSAPASAPRRSARSAVSLALSPRKRPQQRAEARSGEEVGL
jgi:hypothetical protein